MTKRDKIWGLVLIGLFLCGVVLASDFDPVTGREKTWQEIELELGEGEGEVGFEVDFEEYVDVTFDMLIEEIEEIKERLDILENK